MPIRIAIAGVGNCASSLLQGIEWYRQDPSRTIGLNHPDLGGYRVTDIIPVAAFDIDSRKIGRPLEDAIFSLPNNTREILRPLPPTGVTVQMGPILDGVAPHMNDYPAHQRFMPSDARPVDIARVLRESQADMLINYLPVGSQKA